MKKDFLTMLGFDLLDQAVEDVSFPVHRKSKLISQFLDTAVMVSR
jgi:hypothetical protein